MRTGSFDLLRRLSQEAAMACGHVTSRLCFHCYLRTAHTIIHGWDGAALAGVFPSIGCNLAILDHYELAWRVSQKYASRNDVIREIKVAM